LAELEAERKPLLDEAEFYKGKAAAAQAARAARRQRCGDRRAARGRGQPAGRTRAHQPLYDAELARLKQLWAGAAPGLNGADSDIAAPGSPVVAGRTAEGLVAAR
jgi:hypothetical protein